MIDIRSLFLVMVATNAVLALALWVGARKRLQGGLAQWALALVAQASAFVLFAGRESARKELGLTLFNEHSLRFVLTGRDSPGGLVWEWLAGRRGPDSAETR